MLPAPEVAPRETAANFPCERDDALVRGHRPVPNVTFCVLTYGDHLRLAQQALESIRENCPRAQCRLVAGANAVSAETEAYLRSRQAKGEIDQLVLSPTNLNKCPMMRQMVDKVETEFIWWFDDDSYILEPGAVSQWLEVARAAPESTVMWGKIAWCDSPVHFTDLEDPLGFVRSAVWYRGLPPPSWRPGARASSISRTAAAGTADGSSFSAVAGSFAPAPFALWIGPISG
jgi:hypothetical protein